MAPSVYRDEALVSLTVVNPTPEFTYPTRNLLLRKSSSTVPLGRMSKKNGVFAARENNGWIDSAVMSRDHAKLIFDPQSQRVFIKDIGSLHGTFYNDTRLKKHQSQAVKNGDLIQFGVPIDRGSDTCPPCIMRVALQFGALSSPQGPTVFRVPDDSDEEVSASEDNAIRSSSQILRDNGIRPDPNSIAKNPVITIEISDHEMDSPEPEPENCTESTRSIQDQMTEKFTSPGAIDISDEDALFYGDDYDEDYMSEDDNDHSSHGGYSPDQTIRRSFLGNDHTATHLEVTEVHEADLVDRFENDCLPPIINFPISNAASAPNQPPPVHLPSFNEAFRSQEVSVDQRNTSVDSSKDAISANQPSNNVAMAAPGPAEPRFWREDVALNRATESSSLLDSGAEFLKSPLKEYPGLEDAAVTPNLDESSAYQFEVTKKAITQQQQQQPPPQQVELRNAEAGADQPIEPQEKSLHSKRKAIEMSEMTAEEISFAERDPTQRSSSLSTRPRSHDDSAMDISDIDGNHSGHNEPQAKRLRKAAEIFGYAAIGGVAVMSALIATAPTL
ncbi:hypothetical protein ACHAQJ_009384 [Trichoderma viride]